MKFKVFAVANKSVYDQALPLSLSDPMSPASPPCWLDSSYFWLPAVPLLRALGLVFISAWVAPSLFQVSALMPPDWRGLFWSPYKIAPFAIPRRVIYSSVYFFLTCLFPTTCKFHGIPVWFTIQIEYLLPKMLGIKNASDIYFQILEYLCINKWWGAQF